MIYVDLNPIRAQLAMTPEDSDFTGAKERIDDLRTSLGTTDLGATSLTLTSSELSIHDWERLGENSKLSGWLSPVEIDELADPIGPDSDESGRRASRKGAVAISLTRYLELLDWVGQTIRSDKRGAIPTGLNPILNRIGLTASELLNQLWPFESPTDARRFIKPEPPPIPSCVSPIGIG